MKDGKAILKKRAPSIIEVLNHAAQFLLHKGIDTPRLDAEVLLAHILNKDRLNLYLEYDRPLSEAEIEKFMEIVERRGKREPVAYITGTKEFWSLPFKVSGDVLIPRPETEQVLDIAIKRIRSMSEQRPTILDIGTGSGVLAVCIAKEVKGRARIIATDISMEALRIAKLNAYTLGCERDISFVRANLFPPLKGRVIDLIVSNPPYIPSFMIPSLAPEIKDHEPIVAFDGGPDGLNLIREIIDLSPSFLKPGGELVMEIGFDQAERVVKIIEGSGCFDEIDLNLDLSGKDRVVWARMGLSRLECNREG